MKDVIKKLKLKFKSERGYTIQDLFIGCFIITIFIGLITTMMTYAYKTNMRTSIIAKITTYAVEILEDVDKISYEDAQTKDGDYYKSKFSIPDGYNVNLQFSDYGEDTEDIIKIVSLTLSYTFDGDTTEYKVQRLKIKEM